MDTINSKKNRYIKFAFITLLIVCIYILCLDAVYAAESANITLLKKLRLYGIDSVSNVGIDMLRFLGYNLVKGLGIMMDGLYDAIGTIYKYLSFTTSDHLMGLLARYSVLYKSLFMISIVFFGIYLINSKNGTNQLNTVNCILIIIFVIAAMPLLASKMTNLTVSATDYAKSQWIQTADDIEIESVASTILTTNIVDLKKVDKNISGSNINGLKKDKAFNDLKEGTDDWKMMNFNAVMDYDEDNFKSSIWSSQLEMEESGKYELSSLDGMLLNSYYYRYQVISWFNIFAELVSAVLVMFMVCFKCATLIFNIAANMIYTPFVVLTDLTTGQRSKEVLKNFFVLYATIFLSVALLGVYFAAFSFINENVTKAFPKVIMHIALAWVTIDGPDVIERITGVDVGASGVWQKLMGARALMGIAGSAGRTVGKAAGITGKAARSAGNVLVGKKTVDGAIDKMKSSASSTLDNATDGKGLAGFGQNVAGSIQDKMTPNDSSKGLERVAQKNDAGMEKASERASNLNPASKRDNLSGNRKNSSSAESKMRSSSAKRGPQNGNIAKNSNINNGSAGGTNTRSSQSKKVSRPAPSGNGRPARKAENLNSNSKKPPEIRNKKR